MREAGNMNFKTHIIILDVIYFHRFQMVEMEWPKLIEKYIKSVNVNELNNNTTPGRRDEQKLGVDRVRRVL